MVKNRMSNRLVVLFDMDFVDILSEWKRLCDTKDISLKKRVGFLINGDRENLKRMKEIK